MIDTILQNSLLIKQPLMQFLILFVQESPLKIGYSVIENATKHLDLLIDALQLVKELRMLTLLLSQINGIPYILG